MRGIGDRRERQASCKAGRCFEALAGDLRAVLRLAAGREAEPSAAIIDSRTLRSSPESGERAGYDGAKRKKGSKLHLAVDTLGHMIALHVTPASAEDRAEVERLAGAVQAETGDSVELAYVDQRYTGERTADAAKRQRHPARGRQAAGGQEGVHPAAPTLGRRAILRLGHAFPSPRQGLRAPATLEGLHIVAIVCIILKKAALLVADS